LKPVFIAEVKTKSPFGYSSEKNWEELFQIASEFGDLISIHTDSRWGGSFELLEKARGMTNKPILAKGIHDSDFAIIEALERGANYVLVVGRIPQIDCGRCLIEPRSLKELGSIPSKFRAVWNSRNLATGERKLETFTEARGAFDGWLCQASNIRTIADIEAGADAFIVGQHLEEFVKGWTNE
jgi:indole-3-glycerol phosphate synthase